MLVSQKFRESGIGRNSEGFSELLTYREDFEKFSSGKSRKENREVRDSLWLLKWKHPGVYRILSAMFPTEISEMPKNKNQFIKEYHENLERQHKKIQRTVKGIRESHRRWKRAAAQRRQRQ